MAALHISSQICRFNIVYSICLWLNRFCSILLNKYQNISPFCPCGWNVDIFRSDLWPQFHKIVTTLDFYDPTFLIVHVFLFPSIYNLGVCSSGPLKFKKMTCGCSTTSADNFYYIFGKGWVGCPTPTLVISFENKISQITTLNFFSSRHQLAYPAPLYTLCGQKYCRWNVFHNLFGNGRVGWLV